MLGKRSTSFGQKKENWTRSNYEWACVRRREEFRTRKLLNRFTPKQHPDPSSIMERNMAMSVTEKQTESAASPMKQSQSLNSLPPPNGPQDVLDIPVAAKLLIERPYNSLKVSWPSILHMIYQYLHELDCCCELRVLACLQTSHLDHHFKVLI